MRGKDILRAGCLAAAMVMTMTGAMPGGGAASAIPVPDGAPPRPRRVISINLCTDQLLLTLADRDQIAGLSSNARDGAMSAEAARIGNLRVLSSSAEEMLALRPDLIVGMPARGKAALGVLMRRKVPMVDVHMAQSYADIVASIRAVAAALGHSQRGEAMIARMARDLAAIPRTGRGRVAAYYQRRGYMTGTGTLVDELITRAGFVNLAARLDKPDLAQVSLEEMVAARPDFLIVESATATVRDQGTEMLHHPALRGMKRIVIPQAWTVCGGPAYVLAARSLARQAGVL